MLRVQSSNDVRKHDRSYSPAGNPVENQYQLVHDDMGNKSLVKVGELNIPDRIASYAADCDINSIVKKYRNAIAAGDLSSIQKRSPVYYDASGASLNLADYHQSFAVLKGVFEHDHETFEKYKGDFGAFVRDHISVQETPNPVIGKTDKEGVINES